MKALRKRVEWANQLYMHENQLVEIKERLISIQKQTATLKTKVDADADATAQDKTELTDANSLITGTEVQDLIDLITAQIG